MSKQEEIKRKIDELRRRSETKEKTIEKPQPKLKEWNNITENFDDILELIKEVDDKAKIIFSENLEENNELGYVDIRFNGDINELKRLLSENYENYRIEASDDSISIHFKDNFKKAKKKVKKKTEVIDNTELISLKNEIQLKDDEITSLKAKLSQPCNIIPIHFGAVMAQVDISTIQTIFNRIFELDPNNEDIKQLYSKKQKTWNPKDISIDDSKLSVAINDIVNDVNKLQYYQKYEQTVKMLANGLSKTQLIEYIKKNEYNDPNSLVIIARAFGISINKTNIPNTTLSDYEMNEINKQKNKDSGSIIKLVELLKRIVDPVQSVSVQIINQNLSDIADLGKCSNDLDSATVETIKEYLQNLLYDNDVLENQ